MPILRAAITPLNQHVGVIAYCKSGRTIDSGRLCYIKRLSRRSASKQGCRSTSIAMCQIRVAVEERLESACGYKRTSSRPKSTSALPPKADILVAVTDFRS